MFNSIKTKPDTHTLAQPTDVRKQALPHLTDAKGEAFVREGSQTEYLQKRDAF